MSGITWPALRDSLEGEFADVLAMDLWAADRPRPYVLLVSQLDEFWRDLSFWGLYGPRFARLYQTVIGSRFVGNGPAIILNDVSISRDFPRLNQWTIAVIRAVCVHEFSHALQYGRLCDDDLPANYSPWLQGRISREVADEKRTSPPPSRLDDGHDANFLRMMFHMTYRMHRKHNVCMSSLIHWEQFHLSSVTAYSATLEDEFDALLSLPLVEIQHVSPPAEFVELWNSDTESYRVRVV